MKKAMATIIAQDVERDGKLEGQLTVMVNDEIPENPEDRTPTQTWAAEMIKKLGALQVNKND